MKDNKFSYEDYVESMHLTGRICLSIALLMLIAAPFVIARLTGASINWQGFWPALVKVLIVYIPSCVVEFLIYVPLLGAGACYLAFITGNITNLKLPCAFNSREIAGAEVGSAQSEIISTLSVAVSSLVTMLVIFFGSSSFDSFDACIGKSGDQTGFRQRFAGPFRCAGNAVFFKEPQAFHIPSFSHVSALRADSVVDQSDKYDADSHRRLEHRAFLYHV